MGYEENNYKFLEFFHIAETRARFRQFWASENLERLNDDDNDFRSQIEISKCQFDNPSEVSVN